MRAGSPIVMKFVRSFIIAGIVCLVVLIFSSTSPLDFNSIYSASSRSSSGSTSKSESPDNAQSNELHAVERYCLEFSIGGYLFNSQGPSYVVEKRLTSCQIHSFSPYVEREAAKRFLDPPHNQVYFANSPAVQWFKGQLVLVARIWLDRERYEPKKTWPPNDFQDNVFYTQKFDRYLRPISNGSIMGIPAPKQWWVGDGPIEPRLFAINGKLLCSFNVAMAFAKHDHMDFTVIWDMEENLPTIPNIKGGSPMRNATAPNDMPRDKHWMALNLKDELYFVHNLDPLRVMHCDQSGFCQFVHNEKLKIHNNRDFIFNDHKSHLRGGTPFELYKFPYYVSVAHSTMYKMPNQHRYYTAHLIVLSVEPTWRIVYMGNDLKVHREIYQNAPMVRPMYIDDGFIFPVGLIIENADTFALGVHVNDYSSVLIRIKGISKLMGTIIKLDSMQHARQGPPPGVIQRQLHDIQTSLTGWTFAT